MNTIQRLGLCAFLLGSLALGGCQNNDSEQPSVTGIAAVGAPITGGTVTLRCAGDGSTHTTTTDGAGAWAFFDIAQAALPCASRVSGGNVRGAPNGDTFYSMVYGSLPVNSNITPMTDLAMAYAVNAAAAGALEAWYNADPAGSMAIVQAQLTNANSALRSALAAAGYDLPTPDFNPFIAALIAGASTNQYDLLLDAIAAALTTAGASYDDARDDIVAGTPLPDAPEDTTPPGTVVTTPLPIDKLGASFDDQTAAHLWLALPTSGGISAIDGSGDGLLHVGASDAHGNRVQILFLPNKPGTYACGHASGANIMQLDISYDDITNPRKNYVSSFDGTTTLAGYECSVTVTHAGPFTSQYIYGDDVIEGTFTAKLRQMSPECAGEGNCQPYKSITVTHGKFRMNKSGSYTPPAPGSTLAGKIGTAYAGTYGLSCDEGGGARSTHTVVVNSDGSGTLDGTAVLDGTHPGLVSGSPNSIILSRVENDSSTFPAATLIFDDQGNIVTFAVNTLHTSASVTKLCAGTSGQVTHGALDATAVVGSIARSQTVTCAAPIVSGANSGGDPVSPNGDTAFSVNANGTVILGNLSMKGSDYNVNSGFSLTDSATFGSILDNYTYKVIKSPVEITITLDHAGNTTGVRYKNHLESGGCQLKAAT